jgi:hypothetical protein
LVDAESVSIVMVQPVRSTRMIIGKEKQFVFFMVPP